MSALRIAALAMLGVLAAAGTASADLPASVEVKVARGGNASAASPTLPATMRSATVDVVPAKPADERFFDGLQTVLSMQPTPGRRLMTCVGLYINVAHEVEDGTAVRFTEDVHPLAVMLLSACIELAAALDREYGQASTTAAAAATGPCPRVATQVPAAFTRVGRRYRATVDGTVSRLRGRSRLKVTCRRNRAGGMTLKARPTARGRSLRSVVGPRLRLGLYNPLDAAGSPTVRLTFRR